MSKSIMCSLPCQFCQGLLLRQLNFLAVVSSWCQRLTTFYAGLGPSPLWRPFFLATHKPPLSWYSMTMYIYIYSICFYVFLFLMKSWSLVIWSSETILKKHHSPYFVLIKTRPYKSLSHPTTDSRASSPVEVAWFSGRQKKKTMDSQVPLGVGPRHFQGSKDGHNHSSNTNGSLWGHVSTYQASKPCRSHSSHASA